MGWRREPARTRSGGVSPALPHPFDRPPSPHGIEPDAATTDLVRAQVDALLLQSPSFQALSAEARPQLREGLTKIAAYAAALTRDAWAQAARLGQVPVLHERNEFSREPTLPSSRGLRTTRTQAAADEFRSAATGEVARVTQETLRAIAFPTFVADLIRGTFQAIVDASIQQMEAFVRLVGDVSKTVDEFMADNITDNQARDWLAGRYPGHLRVKAESGKARLGPAPGGEDLPTPDFRRELGVADDVSGLDEDTVEELLVPAARRRLAENRLQMLSTLVMMGMQRIVVKRGHIKATMGFHIDAKDRVHAEEASQFDFKFSASGGVNFAVWNASASTSISYVRSTKSDSDSELNVKADLTGEVEILFETDYMPLSRLAPPAQIARIQGNTPVPEQNAPATGGNVAKAAA
jgi:hypothetical protein